MKSDGDWVTNDTYSYLIYSYYVSQNDGSETSHISSHNINIDNTHMIIILMKPNTTSRLPIDIIETTIFSPVDRTAINEQIETLFVVV